MSIHAPLFGSLASPAAAASTGEAGAWASLSSSPDDAEFHAAWLSILCAQIGKVHGAMLLLGRSGQAGFAPVAVWPDASRDMRYLAPVAELALKERRGLVQAPEAAPGHRPAAGAATTHIGYPVLLGEELHGAVVMDVPATPGSDVQRAMRLLHWSSAWLLSRLQAQAAARAAQLHARSQLVNELLATSLQNPRLGPSALSLCNELALRLKCDRVSLGVVERGSMVVKAISHTAHFDPRSPVATLIADAMDEVLDLDSAIVWPVDASDASAADDAQLAAMAAAAHAQLAASARPLPAADGQTPAAGAPAALCSVPIVDGGQTLGALTLERPAERPFDEHSVALCRSVGVLLGPVFALKQRADRSLLQRAGDHLSDARRALVGPGHPGAKLVVVSALLAFIALAATDIPHRVSARTVVEGAVQRAAVAPFDGYIAQAFVRAGDTVRQGQPLARLQDKDLKLEEGRWQAELELAQRRLRHASAAADRAQAAMAAAQADQSQAQLSLVQEKLARATVLAPFDGLIVAGDLTQLQGSPVETGKLLFEVAPLDQWRVSLQVDERDIGRLQAGQRGHLAVTGLPREKLGFTVQRVTPLATAQDGRNVFRVEARLDEGSPRLRPGMEGVGKVEVGQRSLFRVWTQPALDWLRLAWWRWMP